MVLVILNRYKLSLKGRNELPLFYSLDVIVIIGLYFAVKKTDGGMGLDPVYFLSVGSFSMCCIYICSCSTTSL
jgi:hypothetical protein